MFLLMMKIYLQIKKYKWVTWNITDGVSIVKTLIQIKHLQLYTIVYVSIGNKRVLQMWVPLGARGEPAGVHNRPASMPYVFEHKT